jgi:alkanesulfonate monooxygenase
MSDVLSIFSTCPASADQEPQAYRERVAEVARWSDEAGCEGILIYSDNRLTDPWLVAQLVIQATTRLRPLVALQPAYMHPFTTAKMIATLTGWYGRGVDLNLVAGGFKRDLEALGDFTAHDERYARLEDHARVIMGLLANSAAHRGFSHKSPYHKVDNLKLSLPVDPSLMPRLLVSGSSEAGLATARALDAWAIEYPLPAQSYAEGDTRAGSKRGLRVGLVARETEEEAWRVAEERFPPDRRGEIAHQMAMKVSDSRWHQLLSGAAERVPETPYWLRPFKSYKTFCPYLVGSFPQVAGELARYVKAGFRLVILDVPTDRVELETVQEVIRLARQPAA